MSQDNFQQRKKSVLSKADKSSIGKWDLKIKKLCNKINSFENYYTTSSCSGRILIMKDSLKKINGLFVNVWHEKVKLEDFLEFIKSLNFHSQVLDINKVSNKKTQGTSQQKISGSPLITSRMSFKNLNLKFKQEPMILHVACKNLKDAEKLMKLAQKSGFKKIGIISIEKRIIVEISGSEKIEFPLVESGKLLVEEDFLKIVLDKANKNLKENWNKIKNFERLI